MGVKNFKFLNLWNHGKLCNQPSMTSIDFTKNTSKLVTLTKRGGLSQLKVCCEW